MVNLQPPNVNGGLKSDGYVRACSNCFHHPLPPFGQNSRAFPLSWPPDVELRLSPSYLSDPSVCPLNFLAINVSVISVPSVLTDPTKNAVAALQSHITAEAKYSQIAIPNMPLDRL